MKVLLRFTVLVIYMWLIFAAISTAGPDIQWLPDFEVMDFDGETSESRAFAQEGSWLLVYVQPESSSSERLLNLLRAEVFHLPERFVILVGGRAPGKARDFAEGFPDLIDAQWYVDKNREGFSGLNLKGVPVVLGLHGSEIAWRVNGLLPQSKNLETLLLSWLEQ